MGTYKEKTTGRRYRNRLFMDSERKTFPPPIHRNTPAKLESDIIVRRGQISTNPSGRMGGIIKIGLCSMSIDFRIYTHIGTSWGAQATYEFRRDKFSRVANSKDNSEIK